MNKDTYCEVRVYENSPRVEISNITEEEASGWINSPGWRGSLNGNGLCHFFVGENYYEAVRLYGEWMERELKDIRSRIDTLKEKVLLETNVR